MHHFCLFVYLKTVGIWDSIASNYCVVLNNWVPIPVTARSKAWVCDRLLAGIAGSNPTGGMDVSILQVFCVVR
jgi:hypothetical protein